MSIKNKRGQLKLSFGMIFSIILIVIFIAFAFFAVTKIVDLSNSASISNFEKELSEDVEQIWKSSSSSVQRQYSLPKKIEYVCFVDFDKTENAENIYFVDLERADYGTEENLFYYPPEEVSYSTKEIEHLNLNDILLNSNPYCIKNENGKIRLILEKEFNENLVTILKIE